MSDVVVVQEPIVTVVVVEEETSVAVAAPGPQGVAGPTGAAGAAGPAGADGATGGAYTHTQGATSDTWVIPHNLGYFPAITLVDSGGTTFIGEITHDSVNQATARIAVAISGKAYAS